MHMHNGVAGWAHIGAQAEEAAVATEPEVEPVSVCLGKRMVLRSSACCQSRLRTDMLEALHIHSTTPRNCQNRLHDSRSTCVEHYLVGPEERHLLKPVGQVSRLSLSLDIQEAQRRHMVRLPPQHCGMGITFSRTQRASARHMPDEMVRKSKNSCKKMPLCAIHMWPS
jgi:hypothetical protein